MYFYPNEVNDFGTVITLAGRAEPNQAVTGPCRPQLFAVLGNSGSHNILRCQLSGERVDKECTDNWEAGAIQNLLYWATDKT